MAELSKGKDNLKEREFDKKIFETSDSGDAKYISSDEESFISASFSKGDHIQDTNTFHTIAPVMYQLKLMQTHHLAFLQIFHQTFYKLLLYYMNLILQKSQC